MSEPCVPEPPIDKQPKAQEISKWRFVIGLKNANKRKVFYEFIEDEVKKRRDYIRRGGGFIIKNQLQQWVTDMQQKADKIRERFPKVAEILYQAREKCIELLNEIEDDDRNKKRD